jgi:ppGpp synthetase/RelA/SpoT-type nucleotidyltranferase
MSVVDDFLTRYAREFDFYQEAARICARQCEAVLEQSGIRAMVTSRAKRPDRLREKIESREPEGRYAAVESVYKDIVDLAGVRIALYFPGDQDEVDRLINDGFTVEKAKVFPAESGPAKYSKRFSGYAARHYRLRLKTASLSVEQVRYAEARIEVQVASVLVHAWAEVEHDLVYKPLSGTLSQDEYAILDELNGMVLAGEIALEMLQRSAKLRLSKKDERFLNHYELAAYIYDWITRKGT